jgi:Protein of unknown function (DUF1570)
MKCVQSKQWEELTMVYAGLIVALCLLGQVPRPALGAGAGRELESARRSILANQGAQLKNLAERVAREGDQAAARRIRDRLPSSVDPDGPTRFVPLPDVVTVRPEEEGREPWRDRLREIEARSAQELFKLAQSAAKTEPPSYALASLCLRAVIERQPDHREARRLLGYVPHRGGWARPFAVRQLKDGYVSHPTFGWVPAEWVPHLDRGELPAPSARGQKKVQWLAAAEANNLRANWSPPWRINTEHFEIQTNVTLDEAITFGRRLEAFHDLFTALLADILGENLPLVRRFKDPSLTGETGYKPHSVYYFGSKSEYVDYLSPSQGQDIAKTLGFYPPPKSGGSRRMTAYFFRDPGGQLPVTATLYHEVSHQLLFETAGTNGYTRNVGNYWVFEGLGTYFETVVPQSDGSLEVGGLAGARIEAALKALVGERQLIPLAEFVAFDQSAFNRDSDIYLHYQQAMALTVFLMQWHEGTYRDAFLDYVRDAYRGSIKHGTGRELRNRLGQTYAALDSQFRAFLKNGDERLLGKQAAVAQPVPNDAIRTVPRQ